MADETKKANVASTTPDEKPVVEETKGRQDETVPGGRYLVNGRLVDAEGRPVKE